MRQTLRLLRARHWREAINRASTVILVTFAAAALGSAVYSDLQLSALVTTVAHQTRQLQGKAQSIGDQITFQGKNGRETAAAILAQGAAEAANLQAEITTLQKESNDLQSEVDALAAVAGTPGPQGPPGPAGPQGPPGSSRGLYVGVGSSPSPTPGVTLPTPPPCKSLVCVSR